MKAIAKPSDRSNRGCAGQLKNISQVQRHRFLLTLRAIVSTAQARRTHHA
jgi:hypothetical protein